MNFDLVLIVILASLVIAVILILLAWKEYRGKETAIQHRLAEDEARFESELLEEIRAAPSPILPKVDIPANTAQEEVPFLAPAQAQPTTLAGFAGNMQRLGILDYFEAEVDTASGEKALVYRMKKNKGVALLYHGIPSDGERDGLLKRFDLIFCWQANGEPFVLERFQQRIPSLIS